MSIKTIATNGSLKHLSNGHSITPKENIAQNNNKDEIMTKVEEKTVEKSLNGKISNGYINGEAHKMENGYANKTEQAEEKGVVNEAFTMDETKG